MSFDCTVLTMFPDAFPGPLGVSLIGTACTEQGHRRRPGRLQKLRHRDDPHPAQRDTHDSGEPLRRADPAQLGQDRRPGPAPTGAACSDRRPTAAGRRPRAPTAAGTSPGGVPLAPRPAQDPR